MERLAGGRYERLTADEMDEHRRQNVAYQYLCHLEEAKRWMEACLQEGLAPPTELEESLRNGVVLARLGHFFAPEVCPLRKIYDLDQAYFRVHGLHFRHTDNISRWRGAMSRVGLPTIFHPETTDVYDKKNMPRLVYCIHALSLYLSRLGLAPQIQDLYGKVSFTEEEINHMKQELGKYGLQLPPFSKIGGILANELSVDEASVHAAVLAINRALEMGIVAQTLAALHNPSAMLAGLREGLGAAYHEVLSKAKVQKAQSATNQVDGAAAEQAESAVSPNPRQPRETPGGDDIYTQCLTQAEIQGNIDQVNVKSALRSVDDALEAQDARSLCSALQDPALALRNLRRENEDWYLEQLCADREQQALVRQVLGSTDLLKQEEIQSGLHVANERAEQERAVEQAVGRINTSLRRGVAEETVRALSVSEAQLPDVFPFAADLYQRELASLQQQHPQGELAHEEVFIAVEMLSAVALVNQALEDGDARSFWRSLASPGLGLSELEKSNVQRYFDDLAKQKCQSQAARKGFLSWNDIQASVNRVNASVEQENEKILAIRLANEALGQDSPEGTLRALLLPSAGFCAVGLPTAKRYHAILTQMLKQKVQVTGDAAASLWWEEIQEGIFTANRDTAAAQRMALGIAAINQAIKEGNPSQTVRVLRNPDVRLCGVVAECATSYQAELGAIAAARSPPGRSGNPWVQHRLKHGMDYYFSLQTFEGTWERPRPCAMSVAHLSREEIQSTITRVTASHDRHRLWESHAPMVTRLQAQMRGFLVRREFVARQLLLTQQASAALRIQACWRGYRQRKSYRERLCFLQKNTCAIVKIQAWVRMWRARRRYCERLHYFRRRVQAVTKIQAFFRASKAREDYRLLVRSANPPLSTVRRFAHLLEQSQQDYWEELELLELQERVVRGIRHNRQLESDLGLMDIKIGLLVKNRITLQEVVSHCKKLTRKNKGQLSDLLGQSKERGLKALSKEKRKVLEGYQHLFYQLQSHPAYLARLIPQMPQGKAAKSVAPVIFALYNYASSSREACLLLQLFRSAMQEEVKSKATQIQDILTGDPAVTHLVVSFYRSARGRSALRQILAGPVQDVLQDKTLRIHTSPVDIYRGWINQLESQSGRKSDLPYDVSPEQALGYPEVQRRLDISIHNLLAVAERFLSAIVSSVDQIPYGMRYIAKSLRMALAEKFPNATAEEIDKSVGNLLYYRFMNPAIVAPDAFDVVELSAGLALHPDQRRNLGSVAKILQHAAANQLFEGESSHLRVVNPYLQAAHQKFREFICAACCVPEPEERFSVDKYSELVAITKPVVYLTVGELVNMHKLLLEWRHTVAPSPQDPLHELLEDLGELPTVQSLIGESDGCDANGDVEQTLCRLAKIEISLVLSSKFDMTKEEAGDAGRDAKSLLLSTKQMLADVIQSQPGESLVEILHTPASDEQETFHQRLMKRRATCSTQVPDMARPSHTLAADSSLSLEEKKRTVIRNLRRLESLGLVTSASQYQSVVSEMAKDICQQRRLRQRRRAERAELQQALRGLGAKRVFHEEQVDYYGQYLRACLAGLASRSRPRKKQAMRRYTAAQLSEKGILLEIEGLPASQFRNVIFEIVPCGEAGEFQVKAKFMGIDMENFNLHYQDLLQLQYEGVAIMKMFGKARVNVNLLIFLLNKKFFQK